jgi:hypothetical protein
MKPKTEVADEPRALCGAVIWREAMSSGEFFASPCMRRLGHPGEHSIFDISDGLSKYGSINPGEHNPLIEDEA